MRPVPPRFTWSSNIAIFLLLALNPKSQTSPSRGIAPIQESIPTLRSILTTIYLFSAGAARQTKARLTNKDTTSPRTGTRPMSGSIPIFPSFWNGLHRDSSITHSICLRLSYTRCWWVVSSGSGSSAVDRGKDEKRSLHDVDREH